MADFVAVIRRAVDGLTDNSPEMRAKVYDKARAAVLRQLKDMNPRPSESLVDRQLDKLEAAISRVEAVYSVEETAMPHTYFQLLEAEMDPPAPPAQDDGPHFQISGSGRLQIVAQSLATDSDLVAIGALRTGLIEAADDLIRSTAGSNAFGHIHRAALRYMAALNGDRGELAVDMLFTYGVRLQNAARRIDEMIASNDYPEMSQQVAEALDSVVALHGPTIMSTETGRALVRKSQDYLYTPEQADRYRVASEPLIAHAASADLLEPRDAEDLAAIAADVGSGPVPAQSTALAHIANANLLTVCATVAITSVVGPMITTGLAESQPILAGSSIVTAVVDKVWLFFTERPEIFLHLAAAAGADLSWLPSFIRWAEQNQLRAIATNAVAKAIDPR